MSEVRRWKLKGFIPGIEGETKAVFQPTVVLAEEYDAALSRESAERLRADVAVADCNEAERREKDCRNALRVANSNNKLLAGREAALREELNAMTTSRDYCNRVALHNKEVGDALQQRLTEAEKREGTIRREFKKLRDVAQGCYQIASSYSGTIDGVEEHGGDDHEDPSCAIFHRLYYAMFDADAALKPVEGEGS